MNRPAFKFFTLDEVVGNHDAKLSAIARSDTQATLARVEQSADYSLCIALGQGQISRQDFNDKRNNRLQDRAERLRREGHEPRSVAGMLALNNVFGLSVRAIRRILRNADEK